MRLKTEPYLEQRQRWPAGGRHILAQFDDESLIVYQAYRPEIGHFAAAHGYFGGAFSLDRMSWIKPNFLWMMYRSGWGTKEGQEVTLAVWLQRPAFDAILKEAVYSTFVPELYASHDEWQRAVAQSAVRLQWDPDHDPSGAKVERRAIQLGLRGEMLARYAREWIVRIEDVSAFVEEQRGHARPGAYDRLLVPREEVYPVLDREVAARLGMDPWGCATRATVEYNDESELTRYVWDHYQSLMTDFERRVGMAILGRMKASASTSPSLAKTLNERWGQVCDPEIEAALAEGDEVFRRRVCRRILTQHAEAVFINRCPQCGRVVRTPQARQCFWCGHDWHQA
jgi:hypothetical protein